MPIGGPIVEKSPDHCPAGHACGPPTPDGTVLNTVGWRHCHCPAGAANHGGHRTHHCERPDCPTPWTLIPPCSGQTEQRAIHTR
jgi:hypothetical protein